MGYSETWRILEEIIIEFRKKGLPIPHNVMNDLKSAKTLMKLIDTGENRGEIGAKVEQYLSSIEAYLITEAQKAFPSQRIDEWLRRLEVSYCESCSGLPKEAETRFISGLPRDQKWIRVKPIASLSCKKLEQLADESCLSFRVEKDGHFIVFGKAESITQFVKKMTEETSKES